MDWRIICHFLWTHQLPLIGTTIPMSEDSLQINVFFGGGFLYGTGIDTNFNCRLGALDFLALGTTDIPGNGAMKDQLALQWIQRNIASGVKPDSVTTVGLSVTGHWLSPMTQGLFRRVISISGVIASRRTRSTDTGHPTLM